MIFLIAIIAYMQYAETELHFIVPILAIFMRSFYKSGYLHISKSSLIASCMTLLLMSVALIIGGVQQGAFLTASSTSIHPLLVPADFWLPVRISLSVFLVMIAINNFGRELFAPSWVPESVKVLFYFSNRCFPVVRVLGEETSYTNKIVIINSEKRVIVRTITRLRCSTATFVKRIIDYIFDTQLVIDTRGGLPKISRWGNPPPRGTLWGDLGLLLIVFIFIIAGNETIVPSPFREFFGSFFDGSSIKLSN